MQKSSLFAAAVILGGLSAQAAGAGQSSTGGTYFVSASVSARVPARLSRLRPGMTEAQILKVLGLAGYRTPETEGGPTNSITEVHYLNPRMNLCLVFDCTRKPVLFKRAYVVDASGSAGPAPHAPQTTPHGAA